MSPAIDVEAVIGRPIDEVWEVLTNWDRAHEWMGSIDWIRADGETVPGTTLTFRAQGKDRTSQLAAMEPGKSLLLRSTQGGVTADYLYRLERAGTGQTRASLVAECRTSGLWRLVGPLLKVAVRRADGGQINNLKTVVEAGA